MKTKELMIGDWVMYNPNVFIEDEYEPTKECYPTRISNGADIDLAIENCYTPIPLTAEILEKNGFVLKRDEIFGWYVCGDVSLEYTADGSHNDAYWAFTCGNKDNDVCLIVMHYVHELQHALKLCRIDKEIEL